MPVWSVTEPMLNLWLRDTPVWYQPGQGPQMNFTLTYRQFAAVSTRPNNMFGFGPAWDGNFGGYIEVNGPTENYLLLAYGDGGVSVHVTGDTGNNRYTKAKVESLGTKKGLQVTHPGGAVHHFTQGWTNAGIVRYLLTKTSYTESNHLSLAFAYQLMSGAMRLTEITDAAGGVTQISYTNAGTYSALIAKISTPGGKTADFNYDSTAQLTNIMDAAGMSSGFAYTNSYQIQRMSTPYGTNTFTWVNTSNSDMLRVDEYGLRKHLFLYLASDLTNNRLPLAFTNEVPNTAQYGLTNTFDTNTVPVRNSFYWGPREYEELSLTIRTNLDAGGGRADDFTAADFRNGRMRHWLQQYFDHTAGDISHVISFERSPSPDGTNAGVLTWYDYAGKVGTDYHREGSERTPRFIASKLPAGGTYFAYYERNAWGHPTLTLDTWQQPDGSVVLRTNSYTYDAAGLHALMHLRPDGTTNTFEYDAKGRSTLFRDALGRGKANTYYGYKSGATWGGLDTTFVYDDSAHPELPTSIRVDYDATAPNYTNYFTYDANGWVLTHLDPRGLRTTNTYDNLGRLVKTIFSDGTYTSNKFEKLHLAATRDRLGYWTSNYYDFSGRLLATTNALGHGTRYSYCGCGALEGVTDALNQTISYEYDRLGRRTRVVNADGSWTRWRYDLLNRVTSTEDNRGNAVTNWYNLQGSIYAVSNAFGELSYSTFDLDGHRLKHWDERGILTTNGHDAEGRLVVVADEATGLRNGYLYSDVGLIALTNQSKRVTFYTNDVSGRKFAEVNGNGEVTRFAYTHAGDLGRLTDGNGHHTDWNYDEFGRVTNKVDHLGNVLFLYRYDANNRLTNRWTPVKGHTFYAYDAAGNLTNVDYAASTDLRFQYDPLNRLTNMVDASGVTRYTYGMAGDLTLEDGPWSGDGVASSYTNHLRLSLAVAGAPGAPAQSFNYTHDTMGRLGTLGSPAGSFAPSYWLNRPTRWHAGMALPGGLVITNSYNAMGLLVSTTLRNAAGTTLDAASYTRDSGGPHVLKLTRADLSDVAYSYDGAMQLTVATGKDGGVTNRMHEQFTYAYDAAGNLSIRGAGDYEQTLLYNELNQLTNHPRSGPGFVVAGWATTNATSVTMNGDAAALYGDKTWAYPGVTLSSGVNQFAAQAFDARGRVASNFVEIVASPMNYAYDLNGNLLTDGRRHFTYDDENQLTAVVVTNVSRSEFTYDGKLRRRIRKEFAWTGLWQQTLEVRYLYDGNLVVQERHYDGAVPTSYPQRVVTYTRGTDLSGGWQGAGGIGGLLARSELSTLNQQLSTAYYHSDMVGNVTALVDTNQQVVARYLYEPFGRVIAMTGPLAEANTYRFSSKEAHDQSGLVYYLYRYYEPGLQRWVNRDPKRELGFEIVRTKNLPYNHIWTRLYKFVLNNPLMVVDSLGLGEGTAWFDGVCCNNGKQKEYALVSGAWMLLNPGECTTSSVFVDDQDCDGMTCYGGFYKVGDFGSMDCKQSKKPGEKCNQNPNRRWTPKKPGDKSTPPGPPGSPKPGDHRGSRTGHKPPLGYEWED